MAYGTTGSFRPNSKLTLTMCVLPRKPGEALAAQDDAYFRRLAELRRARERTQVELAKNLGMVQPSVSRLERQPDLYVSTLRRYVEALGGRLEINAVFPDLEYELRFDDFVYIDRNNPEPVQDVPQAL